MADCEWPTCRARPRAHPADQSERRGASKNIVVLEEMLGPMYDDRTPLKERGAYGVVLVTPSFHGTLAARQPGWAMPSRESTVANQIEHQTRGVRKRITTLPVSFSRRSERASISGLTTSTVAVSLLQLLQFARVWRLNQRQAAGFQSHDRRSAATSGGSVHQEAPPAKILRRKNVGALQQQHRGLMRVAWASPQSVAFCNTCCAYFFELSHATIGFVY